MQYLGSSPQDTMLMLKFILMLVSSNFPWNLVAKIFLSWTRTFIAVAIPSVCSSRGRAMESQSAKISPMRETVTFVLPDPLHALWGVKRPVFLKMTCVVTNQSHVRASM